MPSSTSWPRFEEPFRRTLARTVALAGVVGAVLALQRHEPKLLLPRRPRLVVLPGWALHRTRVLERPSGTNSTGTPDASRSTAAGVVEWWDSALCGHGRHGARPTHRGPAAEAMVVRRVPAHRR